MDTSKMSGKQEMDLLRLTTAGSVDDGKSTLIGRLLFDSKSIFEDQLDSIQQSSQKRGLTQTDLALLTDGLRDEREQGITIDVAYRYFSTPKRKFIIADAPGHIQYTRNMVTGASTAEAAIILIDARKGVSEQTFRHTYIAALLNISQIIICINKMDLVDYQFSVYDQIRKDFNKLSSSLSEHQLTFIPISALKGDNVVHKSDKMDWYAGESLLQVLENVKIHKKVSTTVSRFPVQSIIQDKESNASLLAGQISNGIFRIGEEVRIFPSGAKSRITSLNQLGSPLDIAFTPMSITMGLEGVHEIERGYVITGQNNCPETKQVVDAMLCWLGTEKLSTEADYVMRWATSENTAKISEVSHTIDVNTMEAKKNFKEISMNDICKVSLKPSASLFIDRFDICRQTGSFILIDSETNSTVAAGMITK